MARAADNLRREPSSQRSQLRRDTVAMGAVSAYSKRLNI
jgi:hypothetical protein